MHLFRMFVHLVNKGAVVGATQAAIPPTHSRKTGMQNLSRPA